MNKELIPLEALNRICEHLDLDDEYFYLKNGEKTDYKVIEKSLKALEIIKNKRVDINDLINCFIRYDLKTYNSCCDILLKEKPLTQCEYDLLKEVFKDE